MTTNMQALNQRLFHATNQAKFDEVLSLLKQGAEINAQDEYGRTPVMIAAYNHDRKLVPALIKAGADVNIRDNRLETPLMHASREGWLDLVKLALDAGADVTLINRFGGVPIIPASERGHVEIVRELLERTRVDVNHVNHYGWTALLEAIILNNGGPAQQQVIQLLIEHGADVNLADHEGVTPLQHARQRNYREIEQLLLQFGAH